MEKKLSQSFSLSKITASNQLTPLKSILLLVLVAVTFVHCLCNLCNEGTGVPPARLMILIHAQSAILSRDTDMCMSFTRFMGQLYVLCNVLDVRKYKF